MCFIRPSLPQLFAPPRWQRPASPSTARSWTPCPGPASHAQSLFGQLRHTPRTRQQAPSPDNRACRWRWTEFPRGLQTGTPVSSRRVGATLATLTQRIPGLDHSATTPCIQGGRADSQSWQRSPHPQHTQARPIACAVLPSGPAASRLSMRVVALCSFLAPST
jgi:hypothetical protein